MPISSNAFSLSSYFTFQYQQSALNLLQYRPVSHSVYFSNMKSSYDCLVTMAENPMYVSFYEIFQVKPVENCSLHLICPTSFFMAMSLVPTRMWIPIHQKHRNVSARACMGVWVWVSWLSHLIWAISRENVSSEIFEQVRFDSNQPAQL